MKTAKIFESGRSQAVRLPKKLNTNDLKEKVYTLRNVQVMLDFDLAEIYGYEVRALNQQVRRNIARFPEDFMFQLTKKDIDFIKSQFVTLPNKALFTNVEGGNRKLPYAFTEQGIYMLATVLKGDIAEKQSIFIMRAFKEMRHFIQQNIQFVTKNEIKQLTETHEARFNKLEKSIDEINENFLSNIDKKNFMILKGQKVEADKAYIDIYKKAKKSIYVIDDYVDIKTLDLLLHKKKNVEVILFTGNYGKNSSNPKKTFLTNSEVKDFDRENPTLRVKNNNECHDRYIIIDYKTKNETVYHCGASSKDAGNKVCTINVLEDINLINPVVDILLKNKDIVL
ncbi:MAG: ORF6N domain-containing protein [Lachnospiraceae bacterium]|nr:ORF6N domain-containing protein [Lachnospiraceae bacterium]